MRVLTISALLIYFLAGLHARDAFSAGIPDQKVIPISQLHSHLKKESKQSISPNNQPTTKELAAYFRAVFKQRYFFDWETVDAHFEGYNTIYDKEDEHNDRAQDHLSKFADSTQWILPFNYLNGEPVDAYALRHLARQHKMLDIAYLYFYDNRNPKYIRYFTKQMRSLNAALVAGEYESIEDGNGVYEVYRSGYRILNWLQIHNLFLGQEAYTDEDQLYTISTLLQHASHLYHRNDKFQSGNHQTRGMSALAMLSILFHDFEDADAWFERSMKRLNEHLEKEINDDGFQFERSVHYHISDIANYYYVYQLAKNSQISVDQDFELKLRLLFETLTKIAYPDKSAPVLQDDTDAPWAEKNEIDKTMTLGYLLFEEPSFGYFASSKVEDKMYWYMSKDQLNKLVSVEKKEPEFKSTALEISGYFVMREGWNPDDMMMIISAGLDGKKPDHQHGDMLGIQAMANGQVILPNYQVRYSLDDYDFFKNSMVKNVALVDDELQGKEWTGNKGGSGFGKFRSLPNPKTIAWKSTKNIDLFVGSHDGFEDIGVQYSRQLVFVKDNFWIVKDNFKSEKAHTYKQVWQGHYTVENDWGLLRSTFQNGSGCDILILNDLPDTILQNGKNGKEWSILCKQKQQNYSFVTLIYPFASFESRLSEISKNSEIGDWKINQTQIRGDYKTSLSKDDMHLFFDVQSLAIGSKQLSFSESGDLFIQNKEQLSIQNTGISSLQINIYDTNDNLSNPERLKLKPGETILLNLLK